MKKNIILLIALAAISQIFAQTFLVSPDPNAPNVYHSIDEAITAVYQTTNEHTTLLLLPGTYNISGSISWEPLTYPPYDQWHITIKGYNPDTVILEFGNNHGFDLSGEYLDQRDSIENLTIIDGEPAIKVTSGNMAIKNVKIVDSNNNVSGGGGIVLESSGTIEDCIIDNCSIASNILNDNHGGGIYVENNTSLPVTISGNEIMNCSAKEGGAIYSIGTGDLILKDNYIHDNTNRLVNGNPQSDYTAVYIHGENQANVDFSFNVIAQNIGLSSLKTVVCIVWSDILNFYNNTIIDNPNERCFKLTDNSSVAIYNNIFANSKYGISQWASGTIEFTYNLTECSWINYSGITPGIGCLTDVDPLLNAYYVPLWDATNFSPCIDAGSPQFHDPDGSISDIGAKRASDHRVDAWEIYDNSTSTTEWKWLSFPTLDNVLTVGDPDKITNLLAGITNISEIKYNNGASTLYYNNGTWSNPNYVFDRSKGYKFKVNPQSNDVNLDITGFKLSNYAYHNLNQGENWISYQLDDSQSWQDAFDGYLGSITSIKTKNGTATKYGSTWLTNGKIKLSYGDMVIVTCTRSFGFRWNIPTTREISSSYTEEEKDEVNEVEGLSLSNYPNPFNPTTTISYNLDVDTQVELIVYNVKGQKVKTLVNDSQQAGSQNIEWNGNDDNNNPVSSGIYFYKIKTNADVKMNKMILMK